MKRKMLLILTLSTILIFSISVVASAERSSHYLESYHSTIVAEGNKKILIDFLVFGTGKMTSIGVTQIEVQKKSGSTWVTDQTLKSSSYPNFLASNKILHASQVRINGVVGTEYRAIVTFYAANSNGSDSKNYTSSTVTCK